MHRQTINLTVIINCLSETYYEIEQCKGTLLSTEIQLYML